MGGFWNRKFATISTYYELLMTKKILSMHKIKFLELKT